MLSCCTNIQDQKEISGKEALLFPYKDWEVSEPIHEPGPKGSFDEIAVKDPTIVFYFRTELCFCGDSVILSWFDTGACV
jgi:hypothetical protein